MSIKKIITSSIKLLFTVIFVVVLILFIQMNQSPNHPPNIFGYQGLTVLSNSMNPVFQTGDLVVTKKVDARHVEKGDIITFTTEPSTFVTHRVENVLKENGEKTFITKGDNNNTVDEETVHSNNLVGKVIFHIPYMGYLASFISSKTGFLLLILLPLVGYGGLEIYDRIGKKETKKQFMEES